MKFIITFLVLFSLFLFYGCRSWNRWTGSKVPLETPSSPQPPVPPPSPVPVSPVPKPVRPRSTIKRDFAVSYWGERGGITGGQGRSGIVWSRPPDGYEWNVPFWYYEDRDEKTLLPSSLPYDSSSPSSPASSVPFVGQLPPTLSF